MATVHDILAWLEELAPTGMKMEWDNVGLLCGRGGKAVNRVLVALDPFLNVAKEAAERNADLILTHHPLIFHPLRAVTDGDPVGETIRFLIQHDIAAVNAHTNLDQAPGGVNDKLAECLGLREVAVMDPQGTDKAGRPWGLLRCGVRDAMAPADFAAFVKERLSCPGLRFVDGGRPVEKVAVGGGSCGDELPVARAAGCDALVTADVKYNEFWDAKSYGMTLIDAGHFETENPVCGVLAAELRKQFPSIEVLLSQKHRDPICFL